MSQIVTGINSFGVGVVYRLLTYIPSKNKQANKSYEGIDILKHQDVIISSFLLFAVLHFLK